MLSFVHDENTVRCIIFNMHYGMQLQFIKMLHHPSSMWLPLHGGWSRWKFFCIL